MKVSDKIYIDNFSCYAIEPRKSDSIIAGEEVCYIRKDTVVSIIKDYLDNWLDAYKIERLIDKIEKL